MRPTALLLCLQPHLLLAGCDHSQRNDDSTLTRRHEVTGPNGAAGTSRDMQPGSSSGVEAGGGVGNGAARVLSPVLALGQTAQLPGYRLKLVSQRECNRSGDSSTRSTAHTWAAELEITNTGIERLPANPFFATLEDNERYTYTTSLIGCEPILPSKLLEPGETIRGFVPYQLPKAIGSVLLTYRSVLRDRPAQVARFRLEP